MPPSGAYLFMCFCLSAGVVIGTQSESSVLHIESTETSTSLSTLLIPNDAIKPGCSTKRIPVTSTCYAGVHTLPTTRSLEVRAAENPSSVSLMNKARPPGCSTSYSTSTSCWPGVHPQPTFSATPITVTEITSPSTDGPVMTITTKTTAEMSLSVPHPTATGETDYTYYITPKLRTKIVKLANSFCPGPKEKRHSFGGSGLRCRLPQSSRVDFETGVRRIVGEGVEVSEAVEESARKSLIISAGGVIAKLFAGYLVAGVGFELHGYIKEHYFNSGKTSLMSSSSSTSRPGAPTMFPGPPQNNIMAPASSDIFALTQYWNNYFESSWPGHKVTVTVKSTPTRLPCSHGADPQVHPGTAGYCQCTNGKIYPTSPVKQTTHVDGKKTTYLNDCPYTTIPSSTTNLGPTIVPTLATTTTPLDSKPATCFHGASFKDSDFTQKVSSFCSTASKGGYKFTHAPHATRKPASHRFHSKFDHHGVLRWN